MNWMKNMPHRTGDMLGATVPLVLGGSLVAATMCFVVLAVAPPSDGSLLADPPRRLLAGLGLMGLAVLLQLAGRLVRTRPVRAFRYERPVVTVTCGVGLVCMVFGLVWIGHGVYLLLRLFA